MAPEKKEQNNRDKEGKKKVKERTNLDMQNGRNPWPLL